MESLICMAAIVLAAGPWQVRTVEGEYRNVERFRWDATQVVAVQGEMPWELPVAEVAEIVCDAAAERESEAWPLRVELSAAGVLAAASVSYADGRMTLASASGAVAEIPADAIASIAWMDRIDPESQQWNDLRQVDAAADLLVIRKGQYLDYLDGVVQRIDDATIQFRFDDENVPVPVGKVAAVIFYRNPAPRQFSTVCRVQGPSGISFETARGEVDDKQMVATTLDGSVLTLARDFATRIDFSSGRVRYLSSLDPQGVEWNPFFAVLPDAVSLQRFAAPRRDESLQGGALRLGGKSYERGLAMRSGTSVTYRLPDGYRRFSAMAGIDDRVRPAGHVRLVVEGDGRELLEAEITGRDDPVSLSVEISGVRRLTVRAEYGRDMDVADHLDLGDAKITR